MAYRLTKKSRSRRGAALKIELQLKPVSVETSLTDLCRQPTLSVMSSAPLENVFSNGSHRPTILQPRPGGARSIDSILVGGPLRYTNPHLDDSLSASAHYPLSLALHGS